MKDVIEKIPVIPRELIQSDDKLGRETCIICLGGILAADVEKQLPIVRLACSESSK